MKNKLVLKRILCSLITIFVLLLIYFLTPFPSSIKRTLFPLVAILGLLFLILGIALTLIARKEKGKPRLFLMLTGISATTPFVFTILHNLFYGLAMIFENLKFLFEALSAISFIIAIIVAPIVFIVGVVGSKIFLKRSF